MSQTCLTLALISVPMPCPRHGLTLAIIVWLMHVPDMSYTSPLLDADAMSQTWSYTGSHNVAEACPRHVLHWRTNHPMP